jgi:DNA-binding NarL/FixJ family response regulator
VIRLLIVDDHPVVRDGLRGMLDGDEGLEVVGEAASGPEAVARVAKLDPDVVLMDLRMPGGGGVEAISALRAAGARAKVLVLTTYDTDRDVALALEAGATGYVLKDVARSELVAAVLATARGETTVSPAAMKGLLGFMRGESPAVLTSRETEALRLVAAGGTNRDVAGRMRVSEATVKTHLMNAYGKLGVRDRAAAVRVALERGII